MPQTMAPWTAPHMHNMGYSDHGLPYSQQHMMPTYLPVPNAMPAMPQMQRGPLPKPGQSGPWNNEEDSILLDAKSGGMSWEEIHRQHFPGKSANACRKRHERVLAKMRSTDWDDARIQRVTDAYHKHRNSIWAPLCRELGESLTDVEKVVCDLDPLPAVARKLTTSHSDVPARASAPQKSVPTQPRTEQVTSQFGSGSTERV
jgi:hypothetical protein